MELVVLAGGLGSRFGGLKQIEPIDEHGNFIIDYLVFDALRLGASKVIFVIKPEMLNDLKNTIAVRLSNHIRVEFAFQTNNNVPLSFDVPESRKKPLGTAHALLCAKPKISDNFVLVNADDFYGFDALEKAFSFENIPHNKNEMGVVVYPAKNTLSKFGSVKRGVCEIVDEKIMNITETKIRYNSEKTLEFSQMLSNVTYIKSASDDVFVSMNLLALSPLILEFLEDEFLLFLKENKHNLDTAEFFIPSMLTHLSSQKQITLSALSTNSIWKGLTFKEDLEDLRTYIKFLKNQKKYPENLWK